MRFIKLGIYNLAIIALLFSFNVRADDMDDVQALLDAYIETEADLMAQTELMSEDTGQVAACVGCGRRGRASCMCLPPTLG